MDVYIRGAGMPKYGFDEIRIYPDGSITKMLEGYEMPVGKAFPIPPHGRLGDLDRMLADNEIYYNRLGRPDGEIGARYRSVKKSIELAPSIIPAEPLNEEVNE